MASMPSSLLIGFSEAKALKIKDVVRSPTSRSLPRAFALGPPRALRCLMDRVSYVLAVSSYSWTQRLTRENRQLSSHKQEQAVSWLHVLPAFPGCNGSFAARTP